MTDLEMPPVLPVALRRRLDAPTRRAVPVIALVSAVAVLLLLWLVYGTEGHDGTSSSVLPLVNAGLNAGAAICLLAGWRLVRAGRPVAHRNAMLAGLASSALFLAGYLVHHATHGDTPFGADGPVAVVYGVLLASHVLLSSLGLPFILTTVWAAASGRLDLHRRLARGTLPVWLYVSITGVSVALLLRFVG